MGEILYKWKTSAGEVWMGFGDKDTHPNYNGQVENGEPSGLGVIYYPNGNMYICLLYTSPSPRAQA